MPCWLFCCLVNSIIAFQLQLRPDTSSPKQQAVGTELPKATLATPSPFLPHRGGSQAGESGSPSSGENPFV